MPVLPAQAAAHRRLVEPVKRPNTRDGRWDFSANEKCVSRRFVRARQPLARAAALGGHATALAKKGKAAPSPTPPCLKWRRAVLTNVAAGGAQKRGLIVHVRLQAIVASLVMLPNSLFRRGLLWPVEDRSGLWNITCCSGVSTTVEALRQAQFH